jgi:hypothetical protein
VNTTPKVDSRAELRADLDLSGGLHLGNKYGADLKKVKNNLILLRLEKIKGREPPRSLPTMNTNP